jgi:long-chain fatty acid transport protein
VRVDTISWKLAAASHFRPIDRWLLQPGISINTSTVDLEDRTPDVPIDRQIRYGTGVEFNWSDRLSTGERFVYADYGKVKLDNDSFKGNTNEITFSFSPDT